MPWTIFHWSTVIRRLKLIDFTARYEFLQRMQVSDQGATHTWPNVPNVFDLTHAVRATDSLVFSKRVTLGTLNDADHRMGRKCGLDADLWIPSRWRWDSKAFSSPNTGQSWSTQLGWEQSAGGSWAEQVYQIITCDRCDSCMVLES